MVNKMRSKTLTGAKQKTKEQRQLVRDAAAEYLHYADARPRITAHPLHQEPRRASGVHFHFQFLQVGRPANTHCALRLRNEPRPHASGWHT